LKATESFKAFQRVPRSGSAFGATAGYADRGFIASQPIDRRLAANANANANAAAPAAAAPAAASAGAAAVKVKLSHQVRTITFFFFFFLR
jgi:hypothetical protein